MILQKAVHPNRYFMNSKTYRKREGHNRTVKHWYFNSVTHDFHFSLTNNCQHSVRKPLFGGLEGVLPLIRSLTENRLF